MNTIKSIALCLIFFANQLIAIGQTNHSLKVEIKNLRNNHGQVIVSIYNTQKGFPDKPEFALIQQFAPIVNRKSIVEFKNLPSGTYAVGFIHDENKNKTMDFGFLMIPKEGYGVSNNVRGTFGPPSFEKASFEIISMDKTIVINALY
jgi:uncharacterized protein (DUF2141 family)